MRHTLSLATIFAASLFAGCTEQPIAPGTDALAGENGQDGEAAKADGIDNFGFLAVSPRECLGLKQWCSQYDFVRVNRSTTPCFGASEGPLCSAHDINWTRLDLSEAKIAKLEAAIANTTSDTGPRVLIRGTYTSFEEFLQLEPSEVWLAQSSTGNGAGTFVRIVDGGGSCTTAPCQQFEEGRLNSTREATIDGIVFDDNADEALQQRARDATSKPDGLIVVGDRASRGAGTSAEQLRTANRAYLRFD